MKRFTKVRGLLAWKLLPIGAILLAAALLVPALPGGDPAPGGAASYTPSRGEWLCLVLNTQRALFNSEQTPLEVQVRYSYDRSKPDTIQIEVIYDANDRRTQIDRRAEQAQQHAIAAAKVYGWEGWLKTVVKERLLSEPPAWENLYR